MAEIVTFQSAVRGDEDAAVLRLITVEIEETRRSTATVAVPASWDDQAVDDYLCCLGSGDGNDGPGLADLIDDSRYNDAYEVTDRDWSWTEVT